ncbi:MAG: hypothetical protein AB1465_04205 [Patescibacteria group bacterium]
MPYYAISGGKKEARSISGGIPMNLVAKIRKKLIREGRRAPTGFIRSVCLWRIRHGEATSEELLNNFSNLMRGWEKQAMSLEKFIKLDLQSSGYSYNHQKLMPYGFIDEDEEQFLTPKIRNSLRLPKRKKKFGFS